MILYIDLAIVVSTTSAPRLLSCRMRLRLAGRNTAQVRSQRPGLLLGAQISFDTTLDTAPA